MRTSETLLLDFIRHSPQFRIPVNQRRFAWTQRECRQLWEDILDAGERAEVREHFLGPVMYLAAVDPLNAHWSPYLVYDGQQRLTTVSLILKALARHLRDDAAPDGFEPAQIRNDYLLNAFRKGDHQYRLLLKPGDSETLRTGEVPKRGEEYAVFRTHARSRRVQDAGPETLAGDLRTCADHYRATVLGEEPEPELVQAFRELAGLGMKPVWPFLLHLYGDYAGERLSKHDLVTLTRLVTAYAMRRAVCGYKPAAPPPVFARAPRAIETDRYVESVRAYFLNLPDKHAFPSDDAFRAELTTRNMYRFKHRDAVLDRLENHGRKETVQLASHTVDHIMPQGERLPSRPRRRLCGSSSGS